jgi:hypothetical protein
VAADQGRPKKIIAPQEMAKAALPAHPMTTKRKTTFRSESSLGTPP